MVIDDEELVGDVVEVVLISRGYTVLRASSIAGTEALLDRYTGPIDLLLTDVQLRGQETGLAARDTVFRVRGEIPTLFMSGWLSGVVLPAGVDFLAKPFAVETLLSTVRVVLDRRAEPKSVVGGLVSSDLRPKRIDIEAGHRSAEG